MSNFPQFFDAFTLLKSKLHRATVTRGIARLFRKPIIDRDLMDAAGFLHNEKILVGNISNGERFETYCIGSLVDLEKLLLMERPPTRETRRLIGNLNLCFSRPGSRSLGTANYFGR